MRNRILSFIKKCRGAAAVELAVIAPLFLLLAFGIIEFGRYMMVCNMLTSAARDGAQMAILDGSTNSEVMSSIQTFMNSAIGVAPAKVGVKITTTPGPGNPDPANLIANCRPGDLVSVVVHVPFDQVTLIPVTLLAGHTLTGQSALRHE